MPRKYMTPAQTKSRKETLEMAKEICTCGHSRVAHAGPIFHGHCFIGEGATEEKPMAAQCPCPKFTWARKEGE